MCQHPACQHLAHLPAGSRVTCKQSGETRQPLLCPSSPARVALPAPRVPSSVPASPLRPHVPEHREVQPGCRRIGCILNLFSLVIFQRAVSETLQGQLEELERAAARLQELCPARLCPVSREVQGTLWAWARLRELLRETQARMRQAGRLWHFFKDYLAMM